MDGRIMRISKFNTLRVVPPAYVSTCTSSCASGVCNLFRDAAFASVAYKTSHASAELPNITFQEEKQKSMGMVPLSCYIALRTFLVHWERFQEVIDADVLHVTRRVSSTHEVTRLDAHASCRVRCTERGVYLPVAR